MSDVESIEITEYNSIDSISLSIPDDVSAIQLSYSPEITDIAIDYVNEITNIRLDIGEAVQSVYSVNNLTGTINLTYSQTLGASTASGGVYLNNVSHNLDYSLPIVFLYNQSNQLVFSNVSITDSNNVTIKSAIDISGYKVVVQR